MDPNGSYSMHPSLPQSSYSPSRTTTPFKLDEGFSEDIRSQDDGGQIGLSATASGFEEWVMAQTEKERAGMSVKILCIHSRVYLG